MATVGMQRRFWRWRAAGITLLALSATAIGSSAQTFTRLATFNGANGLAPVSVVQGFDGNFYGTTTGGGAHRSGTVFKITPAGALTTLYSFCALATCADGSFPESGLVLATDGNLYGTTSDGGFNDAGTFFRVTRAGRLTTLYSFCGKTYCTDGLHPFGPLTQATDGNFYGTTEFGGTSDYGTVFKMSAHGTPTILYSFCHATNCPDGAVPNGQLIQAADGNFYGTTTSGGGPQFGGTVFRMTPAGKLTTLYSFCALSNCADGAGPQGGFVLAKDGTLYGTTSAGGTLYLGTVFKLAAGGKLTTLYSFCSQKNCADGVYPYSGLLQAADGGLYGTANQGGASSPAYSGGTIFKVTPLGVLTTLYSFCSQTNCPGGAYPLGLFQGTDGNFYGGAENGGAYKDGTLFRFGLGLPPFVTMFPAYGKAGAKVAILGTSLTGTTAVKFHGTKATFVVDSNFEITATVPSGATSGTVTVTTPKATLGSNVAFRILP